MKTLVYDGDCPLCVRSSALAVRAGLVDADRRRAFGSFPGPLRGVLVAAGIGRHLVVLDPDTGETRGGIPGLLWLLRDTPLRPLAAILGLPPFRWALSLVYAFVARNRRMLLRTRCGTGSCALPD